GGSTRDTTNTRELPKLQGQLIIIGVGSGHISGMSDPRGGSDSDRDSITGWTLVDREESPEPHDPQQNEEGAGIAGAEAVEELEEEEGEQEEEEDESGCGMEEDEVEEELTEELVHMGQHVQEVKASSGSESSDIETLEAPGPEDFYQDHCLAYDSLHSSFSSYQCDNSLRGFAFVRDHSGDADVESLASTTDISVLDEDKEIKDVAAMTGLKDDETDLSLASSPSLPEDLPAIKPDKQYQHTPSADFNGRLNTIVMLTIATVLGLAIGHFLGWSSRSLWQDSLNSAQVRKLRELQDNLLTCINHGQESPFNPSMTSPIKPSILETTSPQHTSQSHFSNPTPTFKESFEPEPMIHMAADMRDVMGYESLVESIVPPLEDAGVVVGSHVQRLETNHYYKPNHYENNKQHRSDGADNEREMKNVIRNDDNIWRSIDFELHAIHDSKLDLDHLDSDPIFPKPNIEHKWLTEPVFEDNNNDINIKIKTASEITFDSEDLFISKVSKETKQPEVIKHLKNSPIVDFAPKTQLPKKLNPVSQSKSIPSVSDLIPDNIYEDDYILMPLETDEYINKYEELPVVSDEENIILSGNLDSEEYDFMAEMSQYVKIPCSGDWTDDDDDLSEVEVFPDDDLQDDSQWLDTTDISSFSCLQSTDNFITLSSEIEELTMDLSQDLGAEMPAFVDLANNQIIDSLAEENQELSAEMTRLQQLNIEPIKIQGKTAKESRILRERISRLITENEELRVAVSRMQFNKDPSGDKAAFGTLSKENHQKRVAVSKLTHLVPDVKSLKDSANMLQVENEELRLNVGKLRYEQPMPRELNALTRELDSLKQTVKEAEDSKKTPENLAQAKTYVSYMSEVMAALNTLNEFGEGSIVEQMDVAADFFEEIVPVGTKIAPAVKRKIEQARAKFGQLRTRLGNKWEQIKTLSKGENLKAVGTDTLGKMNRVVVNVVNKMKEIGHATLMKKGKAAADKTVSAMADGFTALDQQFDKTWKMLQAEIKEPVHFEKEMKEAHIKPIEIEEEEPVTTEVVEEGGEEVEVVSAGDLIRDEPIDSPAQSLELEKEMQLEKEEQEKELSIKIKKSKELKDQKRKEKEDKKLEKEKKKKEREADKQKKREERKERKGQEKKEKKDNKDKGKQYKKEKEERNRNTKENVKDKKKVQINNDDKPYYKGQYNKDEKKHRNVGDDNDDDDDDDKKKKRKHDDDSKNKRKRDDDDDDDDRRNKESKMKQRWSKPAKYNMRQETAASNSKFIKRKGKNDTHESHYREGRDDWESKRGKGREESRKREKRSEWQFDRARDRREQREQEKKAEWYFDRAQGRKENKYVRGSHVDGYGHNKYESRGTRRRYVRFSDDDDDGDDSDDEKNSKHFGGRHKKKGRREWVMPNFEYTGKAYYR
ncbi:unnamed protein product, partial [Meganyctiphanes norvegica]